jgi:hypothetical protein
MDYARNKEDNNNCIDILFDASEVISAAPSDHAETDIETIQDAAQIKLDSLAVRAMRSLTFLVNRPQILQAVSSELNQLLTKYGIDPSTSTLTSEGNVITDQSASPGGGSKVGFYVTMKDWSDFVLLNPAGKLPSVKFKSGSFTFELPSRKVTFGDGAVSLVNGHLYKYHDGHWSPTQ